MYVRASILCCFHNGSIQILSKCCVGCVQRETKVSKHVALHPQKRDGLLGTGEGVCVCVGGGGGERKSEWLDRTLRPGQTEEAVDHRQNNNYVKAVGTSALHSN